MTFNKYKGLINSKAGHTVDEQLLQAAFFYVRGAQQWIKSPVLVLALPSIQQGIMQDLWTEGVTVELFDKWASEITTKEQAEQWSEAFYYSLSFPTKWDKSNYLRIRNEQ